jgi:hypothetical protein
MRASPQIEGGVHSTEPAAEPFQQFFSLVPSPCFSVEELQVMDVTRNHVDRSRFNGEAVLPFQLRLDDFALAMQDVYDFFYDVNIGLVERGLERLDDMLRPAIMSGLLSDMMTASLAMDVSVKRPADFCFEHARLDL